MMTSREEIMRKAAELRDALQETEEIAFYKRAEETIDANSKVQEKIAEIKLLQKQSVNLEHYGKFEAMKETEAEIERLKQEIDDLPVVRDFRRAQVDANDLLQSITREIDQNVTRKLEMEE
nr:YlbF family regulator [Listeria valentina]